MAQAVVNPRIRGFICTTSHPEGCAANVRSQIEVAMAGAPGRGLGNVLVIGSSAGYGLSSLITTVFGYGARALSVCFEKPGQGERPGTAGFYNLAEVHRQAKALGRTVETINGDAFSHAVKDQAIAALQARFGKVDLVVYSLASPKRKDPDGDTVFASTLKPIGGVYTAKTVDLDAETIGPITIQPATETDIANTRKVMGGEDWELWIDRLDRAGLLAPGCRTVAYSYIGPKLTYPVYRAGTIGAAKDHLESTGHKLHQRLQAHGGGAWVSVNKALVTQASSAIPVVPLYISLLYKVMKEKGIHEGTIEQMVRLWRTHLAPGVTPRTDEQGRIRIDDLEMRADVQEAVAKLWDQVDTANLRSVSDYATFKGDFRRLFGFEVPGIDYAKPVEVEASLA